MVKNFTSLLVYKFETLFTTDLYSQQSRNCSVYGERMAAIREDEPTIHQASGSIDHSISHFMYDFCFQNGRLQQAKSVLSFSSRSQQKREHRWPNNWFSAVHKCSRKLFYYQFLLRKDICFLRGWCIKSPPPGPVLQEIKGIFLVLLALSFGWGQSVLWTKSGHITCPSVDFHMTRERIYMVSSKSRTMFYFYNYFLWLWKSLNAEYPATLKKPLNIGGYADTQSLCTCISTSIYTSAYPSIPLFQGHSLEVAGYSAVILSWLLYSFIQPLVKNF